MGRRNAENLVSELSSLPPESTPIIFGCAGALRKEIKAGEVFLISKISVDIVLKASGTLPEASLLSSLNILRTPAEKAAAYEKSRADLVDQEMEYIWKACSESIRQRVVFIRGVIDESEDDISFLGANGPVWNRLLVPRNFVAFLKFIRNWRRYLKGMGSALKKLSDQKLA